MRVLLNNRILISLGLAILTFLPFVESFAQIPDTILLLNRKKILAKVSTIGGSKVYYQSFPENQTKEIDRKQIEKIIYKTGRTEVLNKPAFEEIDATSWKAVILTDNLSDCDGLYKRGIVFASSSAGSRSIKAAEKGTIVKMQKKTANIGGVILFVTKSQAKGGYGDMPAWEMEGVAFGYEPRADSLANKRY
jgi:hypothetical protein